MDCPSCGTTGQSKARCEACGFAFPHVSDGVADDVLSLFLGLVCPSCDAYNDPGGISCSTCGLPLSAEAEPPEPSSPGLLIPDLPQPSRPASPTAAEMPLLAPVAALPTAGAVVMAPPSWMTPPSGQPISTQFAMKKVDLAVITEGSPHGLVAPSSPSSPSAPSSSLPPTSGQMPSPPVASMSTSTSPLPACWRCQTILEAGDKFCRTCGARVDANGNQPAAAVSMVGTVGAVGLAASAASAASAATQIISQLSLPTAPPLQPSSSSTMVLPAMKLAQSMAQSSSSSPAAGPTATMVFGAVTVERTAKLILVRGHNQFGSQWRLQAGETIIGRSTGMVLFPDDTALAPRHARLVWRGADLMLEPELTTNGVYIRLRGPTRLQPGDEFLVGAQRLRVLADTDRPATVRSTDDTRFLGSTVKPIAPIALLKVAPDDVNNEVYFRPQRLLTIGRAHCDITFPVDGFVSERHAQLTNEGSHLTLEDLGSRNGTYVRARTAVVLAHGDLLLLGDQVLRIELPQR